MSRASNAPDDPEISVVMVTYGAWTLTERAIAALHSNTDRSFELIIVDNGSSDETRRRLADLADAKVILNDNNVGFGPATNQGARHARADHLLLLNTDAFVHPGWLEPLLETIRQPGVGAVVPRYLHPDGSLQDAGMLLAGDGTVLVYGDGDDPDRLCYRFSRVIDYGSAACLLIRRSAFDSLGGFDDDFAPAYYEDADLAMRLAEVGLRVVYDPRSTVTHVRYGSGGGDRARELSEAHRRLFSERWRSKLAGRPWTFTGTSEQAIVTARDAAAVPRVLIFASPEEVGVVQLIRLLRELVPRARLTWATGTPASAGFDAEMWLAAGVELVDGADASWLDERLFHYDVIALAADVGAAQLQALDRTQPQATAVKLSDLDGPANLLLARLRAALATAGVAVGSSSRERELLT